MNARTRKAALYAIAAIAILASANALAHSYAGLYDWAVHHRLTGWQAMSWPAEIDVFLAAGELALYVAYLDAWPTRQRVWPWATALTGLAVSVAGNVGHIQAGPGEPVGLADRLTAATSPLAAFAGLSVGLLVLKMTRQHSISPAPSAIGTGPAGRSAVPRPAAGAISDATVASGRPIPLAAVRTKPGAETAGAGGPDLGVLRDAELIYERAAARGERLSQRILARELRGRGHHFPNQHLRLIAVSIGLAQDAAA